LLRSVLESLGEFLKDRRKRLNITLDEVAGETRIRKTILDAIENSRYDLLPPRAFTRGFIKTYATYLKLDEGEVIKRFQEEMEKQEVAGEEGDAGKELLKGFLSPLRILVIFAGFILALVFWFFLPPQEKNNFVQDNGYEGTATKSIEPQVVIEQEPPEEKVEEKVLQEEKKPTATGVSESSNEVEEVQEIVAEKMVLRVVAAEEVWIKFQLDHDDPYEVLLKSGESLTVKAGEKFNLKIGNAGGVELFLNEQSLGNPGKMGEVIDLTLPE
jgi:cytoskeletal protein RodZ